MSYRIVIQTKRNPRADEFEVASEAEAREVALAQSQCDGQRTWRISVYSGAELVAAFRNGVELSLKCGHLRPKPKPELPPPSERKLWGVHIHTATGVHHDSVSKRTVDEAVAFAEGDWKTKGSRTMTYSVWEMYPSGQQSLYGRWRRGRRLKR